MNRFAFSTLERLLLWHSTICYLLARSNCSAAMQSLGLENQSIYRTLDSFFVLFRLGFAHRYFCQSNMAMTWEEMVRNRTPIVGYVYGSSISKVILIYYSLMSERCYRICESHLRHSCVYLQNSEQLTNWHEWDATNTHRIGVEVLRAMWHEIQFHRNLTKRNIGLNRYFMETFSVYPECASKGGHRWKHMKHQST